MIRILTIVVLLALCTCSVIAQDENIPATINNLIGEWSGDGNLFGQPASYSMKWSWTLGDRFLRLEFRNEFTDQKGNKRVMDAVAYYSQTSDTTMNGTWFDSRGVTQPLTASTDDSTLIVLWGTDNTEQGKTIYKPTNSGVSVEDYIKRGEEWQMFGTAEYIISDNN